jgi:hypothetical protein
MVRYTAKFNDQISEMIPLGTHKDDGNRSHLLLTGFSKFRSRPGDKLTFTDISGDFPQSLQENTAIVP